MQMQVPMIYFNHPMSCIYEYAKYSSIFKEDLFLCLYVLRRLGLFNFRQWPWHKLRLEHFFHRTTAIVDYAHSKFNYKFNHVAHIVFLIKICSQIFKFF